MEISHSHIYHERGGTYLTKKKAHETPHTKKIWCIVCVGGVQKRKRTLSENAKNKKRSEKNKIYLRLLLACEYVVYGASVVYTARSKAAIIHCTH